MPHDIRHMASYLISHPTCLVPRASWSIHAQVDRLKALEPQNQRQAHKIKQLEASLHDTETTIRSLHKECEAIKTEAAQR